MAALTTDSSFQSKQWQLQGVAISILQWDKLQHLSKGAFIMTELREVQ